jgi:murein DD-endopeptidase MepM/ murein hydrolase activator NlpD
MTAHPHTATLARPRFASQPPSAPRARRGARRPVLLPLAQLAACALALIAPLAGAAPSQAETSPSAAVETSTASEAVAGNSTSTTAASGEATTPVQEAAPGAAEQPSATTQTTPTAGSTTAPQVQTQRPQVQSTIPQPPTSRHAHRAKPNPSALGPGAKTGKAKAKSQSTLPAQTAPLPSALTPPLPGSLGAAIGGVPDFFIENFRVPPFLLPIYQAAGTAYGIPWQVLAAINEVETDYGRDLSVSSAGAEGWMQFLPSSWAQYGVDANGDGYEDPYNPADAIFAAARYLAAAGGVANIRAAIYSYNHSQAYVDSVMLRAQLLGGTPPELLGAITGLTESRFPVHAAAHFTDGFATVPGTGSGQPATLVGTTIYAPAGAPVIAVQDGQIVAVGDSPTLGNYVSLRDAYGNTYTYAQLGSVAALYPVLEPREHTALSRRLAPSKTGAGPHPSAPASAGVQPHSPLSEAAISSSLALGATAGLETPPAPTRPSPPPAAPPPAAAATPHAFRAGPDEVYLDALHPGVEVLAGTVLGHLGSAGESGGVPAGPAAVAPEAHMLFQIRPAGAGAPLIDPKPILDGWVQLENTSIFRAKGENPFLATSPTAGQVLLESKRQLELQVLRDPGIRFASTCGRGEVQAGQVGRRVLAALEFLSVSGLEPTVSSSQCARLARAAGAANTAGSSLGEAVDISAIDGTPIAGHEQSGSLADIAVHRLLRLQGTMRPRQIATGSLSYTGTANTVVLPADRGLIHLSFQAAGGAREARALATTPLTPQQWLRLVARLGEIPDPTVAGKPSAAAIPDGASSASAGAAATGTDAR